MTNKSSSVHEHSQWELFQGGLLGWRSFIPFLVWIFCFLSTLVNASVTYTNGTDCYQIIAYHELKTTHTWASTPYIDNYDLSTQVAPGSSFYIFDSDTLYQSAEVVITYTLTGTTPIAKPTATITAESSEITIEQSATVHADFQVLVGPNDSLVDTSIDQPVGTAATGRDGAKLLHRDYTLTQPAPGQYTFSACVKSTLYDWASYSNVTVIVDNIFPVNSISGPSSISVGQPISLTVSAKNPTALAYYQIGLRIMEQRGEGSPWTVVHEEVLSTGDRDWSGSISAPTSPGNITYRVYSWNQWMGEYDNPRDFTVTVVNQAPTVDINPNTNQTIYYGQSVSFSSTATDPDGNLSTHTWTATNPDGTSSSQVNTISGASVTRSDSFVPHNQSGTIIGAWTFQYACADTLGLSAHTGNIVVTVEKTTPAGSFTGQALTEGTALPSGYLNALFINPNNGTLTIPGTVTYAIVDGGAAPNFVNGTALSGGEVLPASTYTIRASIPASTYYEASQVDATLVVSGDMSSDVDNDGVDKATEIELGTNPNSPAVNDPNALKFKINTPRQ